MRSFTAGKSKRGLRRAQRRSAMPRSVENAAFEPVQAPNVTRPSSSIRQAGLNAISQAWPSGSAT